MKKLTWALLFIPFIGFSQTDVTFSESASQELSTSEALTITPGVNNAVANKNYNVYSFQNKVYISLDAELTNVDVQILSVSGKLVHNSVVNNTTAIELNQYRTGMYFVRLNINDQVVTEKVFIK